MFHTDTCNLLKVWAMERGIHDLPHSTNDYIANIVEELGELREGSKNNDVHEVIDALADVAVFSITEMTKLGYDPELVMLEVHREISSRTGAWNEEQGKWVKFTTDEAKAKWYKANYAECLMKEE